MYWFHSLCILSVVRVATWFPFGSNTLVSWCRICMVGLYVRSLYLDCILGWLFGG